MKQYKIQYPISAYTVPHDTRIHDVRIDDKYLHIELTDGRLLSVPLWWIPTVYNATPEERAKYELSRDRTMIIWDPDKCTINDEVRIADYLMPSEESKQSGQEKLEAILDKSRQSLAEGKGLSRDEFWKQVKSRSRKNAAKKASRHQPNKK